jgi:hypothetical protein
MKFQRCVAFKNFSPSILLKESTTNKITPQQSEGLFTFYNQTNYPPPFILLASASEPALLSLALFICALPKR